MYVGSESFLSLEGTTHGDPLAMAMYALASVPLIHRVATADTTQTWFAEDATAGARLAALREWWDNLSAVRPNYGYFPERRQDMAHY